MARTKQRSRYSTYRYPAASFPYPKSVLNDRPTVSKKPYGANASKTDKNSSQTLPAKDSTSSGAVEKVRNLLSRCEKHDREFILFCNESGCKQVICSVCLKEDHKNHDFTDLEDAVTEERETLIKKLEDMKKDMQTKKKMLLNIERSELLTNEVSRHKDDACLNIENAVEKIDEKILELDDVRKRAEKQSIFNEVKKELKSLRSIARETEGITKEFDTYMLYQYDEKPDVLRDIRTSLGELTQTEIRPTHLVVSNKRPIVSSEENEQEGPSKKRRYLETPNITFKFTGTPSTHL